MGACGLDEPFGWGGAIADLGGGGGIAALRTGGGMLSLLTSLSAGGDCCSAAVANSSSFVHESDMVSGLVSAAEVEVASEVASSVI